MTRKLLLNLFIAFVVTLGIGFELWDLYALRYASKPARSECIGKSHWYDHPDAYSRCLRYSNK